MVIGVKCAGQLGANHIPVMFSKGKYIYTYINVCFRVQVK